ncbi:cation-translocating P-type ATPase [Priestia megaterium]|uniref:cation-translocating P-type ATPase n=1 Tax=Priestia megaterium TaxID=1404 RepID=UPI00159BF536|nr:HAD-IC family P-type ATPase [Priestia megaterium]
MERVLLKDRFFHSIPGRLRLELFGLKGKSDNAEKFEQIFSNIAGVSLASANCHSGKILVVYDVEKINVDVLYLYLQKFEEVLFKKMIGMIDSKQVNEHDYTESEESSEQQKGFLEVYDQVAATRTEAYSPNFNRSLVPYQIEQKEKVPLGLTLSVLGLGALGIKQFFWGKSSWSRHPFPFYLSCFTAIGTGYPFLKRGMKKLGQERKLDTDLLFGVGSLALALIRENVIGLAGISILQYLNWKRKQTVEYSLFDQDYVSPQIKKYSHRATVWAMMVAGASFFVTKNLLSPLAVLLAANPRPILTSTDYTWKQANLTAVENHQCLPNNGSMYHLSRLKGIIFTDASLLMERGEIKEESLSFLQHVRAGTKIAFLGETDGPVIRRLSNELQQYGLEIAELDENFLKSREEILVITDWEEDPNKHNVKPYYPSISASKLSELTKSYVIADELELMIQKNVRLNAVWNVVGSLISIPYLISAPFVNLISDALTLKFLSKSKVWTERRMKSKNVTRGIEETDNIPWHALNAEGVIKKLQTNERTGLNPSQRDLFYELYGKNILQQKEKPHWWKSYLGQFKEFPTIILGTTALLSLATGHLFDGLVMTSILLINAGISTLQERKAERAVETMTQFIPPNCYVIRNDEKMEISAEDLLPGDVIELEAGERVPADLRVIQAWNVEVNEASLTGESLPVMKKNVMLEEKEPLSERVNMLYMGTHITRGKVRAVVVHTGNQTEMGKLLSLLQEETNDQTPLQKQVSSISRKFMMGALATGVVVFAAGLIRGIPISQMITSSMALTASAIPEGLPVTITVALTAGIFRMAKQKAVVRKISSLETLGRVSVICTDKTGTLTKNEMTVKKISIFNKEFQVTGDGYAPEGEITDEEGHEKTSKDLEHLLRIGLLCSNTTLEYTDGHWNIKGDPTEGALMAAAAKRNITLDNHQCWSRMHEIPFDSSTGMMTVVCKEDHEKQNCYVMSKGSVEKILKNSTHYQKNGKVYKLTKAVRENILKQNEEYAQESLRVLGFAYRPINEGEECLDQHHNSNLIYVGMAGMMDPPKEDISSSIEEAKHLGIKPIMITGDHPVTASAIAHSIGLRDHKGRVMTGVDLDRLSDEELKQEIEHVSIFARVTPEHKLRIVSILQKSGHIVAMTGDGVNDSPAIKKADVGIAMGQTGTQVTKETADIVLKEDHFGSIVEGVKEGRTIISNIRKALGCLLSGNLAEIIVTSTAVIAGLPLPVIPIQILVMNLLTDALPSMVLAMNPGNKAKVTKRQEIADKALYTQVISRGVILGLGSLGLFAATLASGASLAMAQTTVFASLVAGQLIQTFSWRQTYSEETLRDWTKDRFLIGALGASWFALLSTIYIPPLSGIFKTTALPLRSWIPVMTIAVSSAAVVKMVVKMLENRMRSPQSVQVSLMAS